VARSCCRAFNKKIISTGDYNGRVNLFKYPCIEEKQQFKVNIGHSAPVTNVKFLCDDSHLVSVGGGDNTIFVWVTDFGKGNQGALEDYDDESDDEIVDENDYIQTRNKRLLYKMGKKQLDDEDSDEGGIEYEQTNEAN